MRTGRGVRLWRFISIGVGVAATGIAVAVVLGDDAAREAGRDIALPITGLILLLQLVNVVTDSIRYRMVLPERYRSLLGHWTWHRIFSVGRLLNAVIPQAGMAYRVAHLRIALGIPASSTFGSVAVVSWLGNGMVLVFAGIGVLLTGALVGILILGAGLGILALLTVGPRYWRARQRSHSGTTPGRFGTALAGFGESFVELAHRPRHLSSVIGVSLISQISGAAAFVLVASSLRIDDAFVVGALIYSAATVIGVVSLTPAGIGVTELAAGLAGGLLDIGAGVGILVALAIRITGIASVGLLAVSSSLLEASATRREVKVSPPAP